MVNLMKGNNKEKARGVKEILLMGVFWRILFIEGVLLLYSLVYRWITQDASSMDLFWYSVRITILVAIIIAFMMITLKRFLTDKIIEPLESIARSNKEIQNNFTNACYINLSKNAPHEIDNIITTRSKMLQTILDETEERIRYSKALDRELDMGKKIQRDFLPRQLPTVDNCCMASYFKPALQLSGDFYDVFELPDHHVGFVVGDVSDKGVGSALFMALTRSLLRVYSGHFGGGVNLCDGGSTPPAWSPQDTLKTVSLTNAYVSGEHGDDGMFVTIFFGTINLRTGRLSYVNGGHEPLFIINRSGIKTALSRTGPAIGLDPEAVYQIQSVELDADDLLFCYTDGVTEALSETNEFYTRERLIQLFSKGFTGFSQELTDRVKADLNAFTGHADQSDDITMLTIKWLPQKEFQI